MRGILRFLKITASMYCISNASATVNIGMTSGALIKDVQYIIDSLATIG